MLFYEVKNTSSGLKIFEIEEHTSESIDIDFKFDFLWSDDEERSNLLLIIDGDNLNDISAVRSGFIKSNYGYYKYLKPFFNNGSVSCRISIDRSVQVVSIVPFITKHPVFITYFRVLSVSGGKVKSLLDKSKLNNLKFNDISNGVDFINLGLRKNKCGYHCYSHSLKWFSSMAGVASRWGERFESDDFICQVSDEVTLDSTSYRTPPAFLKIPQSIDEWLFEIGDKSRNMISKARRLGVSSAEASPDDYSQDIYEIRTSDPLRQGRSIPDYFYTNPPKHVISPNASGCLLHDDVFIGVFLGGKLISYITLYIFGELAEVNHILCHHDYKRTGAMNFNVYAMVDYLIRHRPSVRYVNYLYVNEVNKSGLDLFKLSMGFVPRVIILYDDFFNFPISSKKSNLNKSLSKTKPAVELRRRYKPKVGAVDISVKCMSLPEAEIDVNSIYCNPVYLKFESFSRIKIFLSYELNEISARSSVGMVFYFCFPSMLNSVLSSDVAEYLVKRFKFDADGDSNISAVAKGFSGGDFKLVSYYRTGELSDLLVLEKVI